MCQLRGVSVALLLFSWVLLWQVPQSHYEKIHQFLPGKHPPRGVYLSASIWGAWHVTRLGVLLETPQVKPLFSALGFALFATVPDVLSIQRL